MGVTATLPELSEWTLPRRIWLQSEIKNQPCVKIMKLKFGIRTNSGPLSLKTNINFQSDVNLTSL